MFSAPQQHCKLCDVLLKKVTHFTYVLVQFKCGCFGYDFAMSDPFSIPEITNSLLFPMQLVLKRDPFRAKQLHKLIAGPSKF